MRVSTRSQHLLNQYLKQILYEVNDPLWRCVYFSVLTFDDDVMAFPKDQSEVYVGWIVLSLEPHYRQS